jgi:hypothetical protein
MLRTLRLRLIGVVAPLRFRASNLRLQLGQSPIEEYVYDRSKYSAWQGPGTACPGFDALRQDLHAKRQRLDATCDLDGATHGAAFDAVARRIVAGFPGPSRREDFRLSMAKICPHVAPSVNPK